MHHKTRRKIRSTLLQYTIVTIGCILSSIAINFFFVPHKLLSGGISGLAIIFYYLFKLPIGLQLMAMNVPLLYAGYRLLGKAYAMHAVFGIMMFSFMVDAIKPFATVPIDDPILSALAGGILSGLGLGLIFRVNGSTGGMDIIAGIIKKYYSFNMGFISFAFNCVITLVAAVFFGLKLAILTLIAMYITGTLTDKVVEGVNRKKTVFIVSYHSNEIAAAILDEIGRGATILHGEGAFTHQAKQVIFVVVSLTQIAQIKFIVEEVDPLAFVIVTDAAEVMGRGFTLPGTKKKPPKE